MATGSLRSMTFRSHTYGHSISTLGTSLSSRSHDDRKVSSLSSSGHGSSPSFEVELATANRKLQAQMSMDCDLRSPTGHKGCKAQGKCGEMPKNYRCKIGLQKPISTRDG
ncbi:hypothetical protein NL676_038775 [Syzygium grande]|nr:hypothetical protein NL676_038775 [Syzygium grande]